MSDGYERRGGVSTGSEHLREHSQHDQALVVDAEVMLWSSMAHDDKDRLEWLLHHEFTGLTRDGAHLSRDECAGAAPRSARRAEGDFTDWSFHTMPWPLVLVTYRLADDDAESRHVSIWDVSTGLARLRFHQGTWEDAPQLAGVGV